MRNGFWWVDGLGGGEHIWVVVEEAGLNGEKRRGLNISWDGGREGDA